MRTIEINVYTFDELSEKAKTKALDRLYDFNIDYEWWEAVYADATQIGLKISSFDLDRNGHAKGEFLFSAMQVAQNILEQHGENCETYKTAQNFLDEYLPKKKVYESENDGFYFEDDDESEEICSEFLKSLLEDYAIMLQKEYEYLTSDEAIIETIKANNYEFTENGELA